MLPLRHTPSHSPYDSGADRREIRIGERLSRNCSGEFDDASRGESSGDAHRPSLHAT